MRLQFAIGAVVVAVGVTAGCGGDDSGTSATTEWAGDVCTAVTTWKDSITSAADSLQGGNVSADSLKAAAADVEDATRTLADDLKGLGRPDTDAGQQAQETIDTLSGQLTDGADTIKSAVEGASGVSGALQAVSTVSSAFATMGQQVSSAVSDIQGLEGGQELTDAFQQADSCSSYVNGS
jgi:methyl-accepting chemotaxis protein